MNAATEFAVDQMASAREALMRALDDQTLNYNLRETILSAIADLHSVKLAIELASLSRNRF